MCTITKKKKTSCNRFPHRRRTTHTHTHTMVVVVVFYPPIYSPCDCTRPSEVLDAVNDDAIRGCWCWWVQVPKYSCSCCCCCRVRAEFTRIPLCAAVVSVYIYIHSENNTNSGWVVVSPSTYLSPSPRPVKSGGGVLVNDRRSFCVRVTLSIPVTFSDLLRDHTAAFNNGNDDDGTAVRT